MNEKLLGRIDCKGHVILGEFGTTAVLFCPEDTLMPFVAARGYDELTGSWMQGRYSSNPVIVWNAADPRIVEELSEPVTWEFLRECFTEAGYDPTSSELDAFVDEVESSLWHENYRDPNNGRDGITEWLFAQYAEDNGIRKLNATCQTCVEFHACPADETTGFCTARLEWCGCCDETCRNYESI